MSTSLKIKSEENLKLAQKIVTSKNRFYASSIHCSYYSCVQLMLHILRIDLGKSDDDVHKESIEGSKNENGFHNWLITIIAREFFRRNPKKASEFNNRIGELKGVRVKADYQNSLIKEPKAKEALKYAELIMEDLIMHFKI
jgi:hypothetical protein